VKNRRVEILIDELVLHGFAPGERYAIGESLTQELERLVAAQGVGPLADVSSLRAQTVQFAAGAKPQTVGAQVARSVHTSLVARGEAS
jgi:hypothetical protein